MTVALRPGTPEDAAACGRICHAAFRDVALRHGFPPMFPNEAVATEVLARMLGHPRVRVVVAEDGGRILGSNVLNMRAEVAAIGPITVDPAAQGRGIGRRLMEEALAQVSAGPFRGARLVQDAFNPATLALYTRLGFRARELLALVQGPTPGCAPEGAEVRPATPGDVAACDELGRRAHGCARTDELEEAVSLGTATVAVRDGAVRGYATAIGVRGHAAAETNDDLWALIMAAPRIVGAGILVPAGNDELLRRCLGHGLKVVAPETLMTIGEHREPQARYLASIA